MAALSFALFSPVATEQAAPSSAAHRPHGLLHAPGSWRASELFTLGDLGVLNAPSSIVGVVPKNIFTYWDDPNNIPDLVAGCIARMHHFNPDWTIYLLYPGVPNVEPPPQKMANACCGGFDDPTHQADWYRSAALAKYGGVWLDSTSIVNQPIDRWADLDMDAVQGWEWVGGNLAMENWGFVVPYKCAEPPPERPTFTSVPDYRPWYPPLVCLPPQVATHGHMDGGDAQRVADGARALLREHTTTSAGLARDAEEVRAQ